MASSGSRSFRFGVNQKSGEKLKTINWVAENSGGKFKTINGYRDNGLETRSREMLTLEEKITEMKSSLILNFCGAT